MGLALCYCSRGTVRKGARRLNSTQDELHWNVSLPYTFLVLFLLPLYGQHFGIHRLPLQTSTNDSQLRGASISGRALLTTDTL